MANHKDPLSAFRFLVEIGTTNEIVGGCSEVSGLNVEVVPEEYLEGGENGYIHYLPGRSKCDRITLKRGLTDNDYLWRWMERVSQGMVDRKNVRIILQDSEGNAQWSWICLGAYPVKWLGPTFSAQNAAIAFESLELLHRGITRY